jgi:beta-lactamase superfamily II metal-dependent hydrolase
MKCEIEFLAVGDASRAGDAIVIRYGEVTDYKLMIVDGGTATTGEKLVAHLKGQFGEAVRVEHVVLTHPDADHASGLRELFKEIPVANLWMHVPWMLAEEAVHLFKDKRWTKVGLASAIKDEYKIIDEILELAWATDCVVRYPFQGSIIGPFEVLSPHRNAYLHLLPQFEKTPDADQSAIEEASMWIGKGVAANPVSQLVEAIRAALQKWVPESWNNERLKDGGCTSASNESSVVLYADVGNNQRYLLTGDAGIIALTWATNYAKMRNLVLKAFTFIQIPHHGSRRNIGPSILNELVGPIKMAEENTHTFTAFVSAPADDAKHPRKIVLNAFIRRGGRVIITQGSNKVHWGGFPPRPGYTSAQAAVLSTSVEDYD